MHNYVLGFSKKFSEKENSQVAERLLKEVKGQDPTVNIVHVKGTKFY